MERIEINREKCNGCGSCIQDCSARALRMDSEGLACIPSRCNGCGHCLAVCPTNAITMPQYGAEDIVEVREAEARLAPERLLYALKCRRSIRQFKEEEVPTEVLGKILEAGRFSPTGGNQQNNKIIVLHDRLVEIRDMAIQTLYTYAKNPTVTLGAAERYRHAWIKLQEENRQGIDKLFFGAKWVIVITSTDQRGNAGVNGGLAAARMELMANALGLGVCYIGFFRQAVEWNVGLKRIMQIGEDETFVVAFVLGYPAVKYLRTVSRKPLNVRYL